VWVELTTEQGELLKRVEVTVTDDPFFPVGRGPSRAALIAEIEAAARALQGPGARPAIQSRPDAPAPEQDASLSRLARRVFGDHRGSKSAATGTA